MAHRERLLAAYALDIASGHNLSGKQVRSKSVKNYLHAAASFSTHARLLDPRFSYDAHGHQVGKGYFPLLSKLLSHIQKWQPGKSDALPLTFPILDSLNRTASTALSTSLAACVADAVTLGLYTGSRCSEYCRGSPVNPSDLFSRVPSSHFAGTFAGMPLALTISDFEFLDSTKSVIPWTQASLLAKYVRVRFRFDKGGTGNFSVRTLRRFPKGPDTYCPVAATIRSINRWYSISGDHTVPLFCYSHHSEVLYLPDTLVTKALRTATIEAYPNPKHLYRLNLQQVRTHSIRVTACFILVNAGLPDHVIEHRLRWASSAWKVYIREGFDTIDKASLAVFNSALQAPDDPPTPTLLHTHDGDDFL